MLEEEDPELDKENMRKSQRGASFTNITKDIKSALAESLGGNGVGERMSGSLVESTNAAVESTRKVSFADSEVYFDEVMEDDVDIRRKINQKLIRK